MRWYCCGRFVPAALGGSTGSIFSAVHRQFPFSIGESSLPKNVPDTSLPRLRSPALYECLGPERSDGPPRSHDGTDVPRVTPTSAHAGHRQRQLENHDQLRRSAGLFQSRSAIAPRFLGLRGLPRVQRSRPPGSLRGDGVLGRVRGSKHARTSDGRWTGCAGKGKSTRGQGF